MPGYETDIRPGGKAKRAIARATLRTPGEWADLTDVEKAAWNKATRAINELMELYVPKVSGEFGGHAEAVAEGKQSHA